MHQARKRPASARHRQAARPRRGKTAMCASPIPTAFIGWMSASPSRIWPTTIARLGLQAPHVVNRPLALVRCPDGTKGPCFFQKHASAGLTEPNLNTVIDSKGRQIIAVEDLNGLLSLVQAGVLEVHVRGSTIDRLDTLRPHRVRHRSRRGRRVAGGGGGRARRARATCRHRSRKLRQAHRRQRPARGSADRAAPTGKRPRPLRRRWRLQWPRTRPNATWSR